MLIIARRELAAYFYSPVSYLVMPLFLLLEGYSFWILTELLNQSFASATAPSSHGAALQYFFGGTFLYWLVLLFLVSVLTMRLIAEERRQGTIEPLLTAPVDEWEVVLGKYLAALAFYICQWLPTLLYALLLQSFLPAGERLDPGPIASGYLGALLIGMSTLSVGLLASSLTRNQILSAVLSFSGLTLLLLIGALGDALVRSGPWVPLFSFINIRQHAEDFGRGIIDSRAVVFHLGVALFALFTSARVVEWRRGQ